MSNLAMTTAEQKNIDSQVEQMMDWVNSRKVEAEQLALDSARLMACTGDRLDRIKNQGFFKRCWNRFTGRTGEMERANTSDMIEMQKKAFRYINMLQENQVLMAHSLLSLKNNLVALAVSETETRDMIGALAQKTLERFDALENRTDQLEISTNLQGWLLGLEEREYDRKFPTQFMRMFRVINDFYNIKKDNWNYNDLMFMRTALRKVGIDPKLQLSISDFINNLTEEIQTHEVGLNNYILAIEAHAPENAKDYSKFVIDNVSSPITVTMYELKDNFSQTSDIVEVLQDELNISAIDAQKRILRKIISSMNVNMDHRFAISEAAIEIMGCLRLIDNLEVPLDFETKDKDTIELNSNKHDISNLVSLMIKINKIEKELQKIFGMRNYPVHSFIKDANVKLNFGQEYETKKKFLIDELKHNTGIVITLKNDINKEINIVNQFLESFNQSQKIKLLPSVPKLTVNLDSKLTTVDPYGERKTSWVGAFEVDAKKILDYVHDIQEIINKSFELLIELQDNADKK